MIERYHITTPYLSRLTNLTEDDKILLEENKWKDIEQYEFILMINQMTDEDREYFSEEWFMETEELFF